MLTFNRHLNETVVINNSTIVELVQIISFRAIVLRVRGGAYPNERLVLQKENEALVDKDVRISVWDISRLQAKLSFKAPRHIRIDRGEIAKNKV